MNKTAGGTMFNIKTFVFNPFQMNTYLVYKDREAMLIDAGCYFPEEKEELKQFTENSNLNIKKIISTHGHVDHNLGNKFVFETWHPEIWLHNADEMFIERAVDTGFKYGLQADQPPKPTHFMKEGMSIEIPGTSLKVIHVPGHSPGGVALFAEEEKILFSGDILFNSGIGRSDLPGGSHSDLINGIREKLFILDNDVTVYPGHGEPTTIGTEKTENPFF